MTGHEDQNPRESRRILDRIDAETDPSGATLAKRLTERAGRHFGASDADQDDAIEVWGTRIGRGLGLILTIALLVYLVTLLPEF